MSDTLNTKEGNHLKIRAKTIRERLHISIAITLIVGLSISVWIYATAEAPVETVYISGGYAGGCVQNFYEQIVKSDNVNNIELVPEMCIASPDIMNH
jgi:hypothetical protein